jgi:wyosine [tRNA(Phe)-imidazoG37] synthetase (radical SAM superfamily)
LPLVRERVYGPILSRRLGLSLGINLLSLDRKVCSFDCIYCHCGRTDVLTLGLGTSAIHDLEFVAPDQLLRELETALRAPAQLDTLTFSGNGEPTLHPYFAEIAFGARRLRDRLRPEAKIALFSNATMLDQARVRDALAYIDLPILKLDAGDREAFSQINRPAPGIEVDGILAALRRQPKVVLQTIFVGGGVSNAHGAAFEAWVDAVAAIQPISVQLMSTDYPVPEPGVERVPAYRLRRLAQEVRDRTGVPVRVYWVDV